MWITLNSSEGQAYARRVDGIGKVIDPVPGIGDFAHRETLRVEIGALASLLAHAAHPACTDLEQLAGCFA